MATVNLSDYKALNINNAGEFRIGIVVSEWNAFATFSMRDGAVQVLENENVKKENIHIFHVSGAFELIYAVKKLCDSGKFDAVIAIGCVIRGETPHFEYICQAVSQGIKDCNILTETPAIFCILTDNSKEQSVARSGGTLGNKGVEAAAAALKTADFRKNFDKQYSFLFVLK